MLPYTSIPLGSVLVCSLFVAWREEGGGRGGVEMYIDEQGVGWIVGAVCWVWGNAVLIFRRG